MAALYKISVVFSKLANIRVESLRKGIFYLVDPCKEPLEVKISATKIRCLLSTFKE
jgi:hypothetical protein